MSEASVSCRRDANLWRTQAGTRILERRSWTTTPCLCLFSWRSVAYCSRGCLAEKATALKDYEAFGLSSTHFLCWCQPLLAKRKSHASQWSELTTPGLASVKSSPNSDWSIWHRLRAYHYRIYLLFFFASFFASVPLITMDSQLNQHAFFYDFLLIARLLWRVWISVLKPVISWLFARSNPVRGLHLV